MKFKRSFLIISFALVSIFSFILLNTSVASAADISDVLKQAPQGISVSTYMSNGQPIASTLPSGDIYKTNSATIVNRTGDPSDNGNIVSLAEDTSTYGAMWSTTKTFNINQAQNISAWLYFGSGDGNTDAANSQGMAFVLQGDDNGVRALGAGDQGLGVYGFDKTDPTSIFTSPDADKSFLTGTAIQHSVALEFDSASNSFYDDDYNYPLKISRNIYSMNGYDTNPGIPSPANNLPFDTPSYGASGGYGHIALVYPALEDSYFLSNEANNHPHYKTPTLFNNAYILIHNSSKRTSLVDGEDQYNKPAFWHHVSIKWTPATGGSQYASLSYVFNDKNPDYSDNTRVGGFYGKVSSDKPIKVDTKQLNPDSKGNVRWGFTGANGSDPSVSPKLVAFDSVPDSLYATADANIVDKTLNNKVITNDSIDKKVRNGDSLNLNYNLNYVSGNLTWQKIISKISIPTGIDLAQDSDGYIAKITSSDKNTNQYFTQSDITNGTLQATIKKTLSATDNTAKLTIFAKAVNTSTKNIDVDPAPAIFRSSDAVASTSSPEFTVLPDPAYTLNLASLDESTDVDLTYGAKEYDLNLSTTLSYSDNHDFKGANITYNITIGDRTYSLAKNASSNPFKNDIDLKSLIGDDATFWDIFKKDTQAKVEIQAVDTANSISSNPITYNIKASSPNLVKLIVSNNLEFKDINYGDSTEYLPRKRGFSLSVTGKDKKWKLEAALTKGLYLGGQLPANDNMALIFRKTTTTPYEDAPALTSDQTLIDEDSNNMAVNGKWDVASKWKDDSGILLRQKQDELSKAGHYSGTIEWTIIDSSADNQ